MAEWWRLDTPEFEEAIARKLLPRGLAWTRLAGTVLQGFWTAVADVMATLHRRIAILTEREAFPPSSVELLGDWERVLGLPDPCLGPNPATPARQAAVAARLAQTGGQSLTYYGEIATLLGGGVSVLSFTEYHPFRIGKDHCGDPIRCAAWAYIWLATLNVPVIFRFEIGISHCGEPLWTLANNPVECELARLKPAHTKLNFAGP